MATKPVSVHEAKKMLGKIPLKGGTQKKNYSYTLHVKQLAKKYPASDHEKRLDILTGLVVLIFAKLENDKSLISLAHDVARKGKPKKVKKA